MTPFTTELCALEKEWSLRVKTPAGIAVEYRYDSERQARFMAAVFELGPSRLPPAMRMIATSRRKSRAPKRTIELDSISPEEIDSALGPLEEPRFA
jgi:hypothetical protein